MTISPFSGQEPRPNQVCRYQLFKQNDPKFYLELLKATVSSKITAAALFRTLLKKQVTGVSLTTIKTHRRGECPQCGDLAVTLSQLKELDGSH